MNGFDAGLLDKQHDLSIFRAYSENFDVQLLGGLKDEICPSVDILSITKLTFHTH